ncbi:adenylate cyclase type 10-like isoform X2 [Linepithema humile]|uniref:adenylate cyclase type 10-like isoform X2 n=1 Tax=Linepithema humile TaxID=83485 RepID=UPI00351E648F
MNPYEQSLITCAATLGLVFKRNALQNVMLNEIPPHTTNAISQMFRIRILECAALQRRDFRTDILIFCIDKKRSTFSDMHHLQFCHCNLSQQSAPGQCKILEFKYTLFYNLIYDMQSNEERKEHHARAVRIYSRDAQKCNCCDGGRFLRIPSKDIIVEKEDSVEISQISMGRKRTYIGDQNDKSSKRRSIFFARRIVAAKKQEPTVTRRVSIMPTHLDNAEEKVSKNQGSKESITSESLKFWKRQTSIAPKATEEPLSHLEEFSHIDYRDCQCDSIISYLFWKLHKHIEQSGDTDEVINFLLEYSSGLIQTAQSLYAVKLLLIAAEKNEAAETSARIGDHENIITNKGIILALTGDAYSELGNYAEAKKCYTEAMKLRGTPPKTNKAACYNIKLKMYYRLQNLPRYTVNNRPRQLAVKNLELASYMRRVCVMYLMEDKLKIAQLFALRSFKLAFLYFDSFLEKGKIYLVTVRVLHRTKNIKLIRHIERSMLTVINKKFNWNDVEELVMVANIYLTMYQIRALRGELEEAVDMGVKVLKICGAFHHDKVMLNIMPSLIQIMLWTKRINEAVDLMRELYFLAEDDVDLSSKTWYYALSLEFILDAGIVLESYQTSYNYYMNIVHKSKSYVWRDPESLYRLSICLGIYQLRMGYTVTVNAFEHRTEEYTKDISWDHFSRIFSCSKRLEYYLLTLLRHINIKHSNQLLDLIEDIYKVIKCLKNVSNKTMIVKPHFYLLMAYLNVLRGRKSTTQHYLHEAQKFATSQGNKLIMAWIMQNRRTWKKKIYNNMARYWLEYIGSADIVAWQYIRDFNIDIWSTILYSLPTPDSYL